MELDALQVGGGLVGGLGGLGGSLVGCYGPAAVRGVEEKGDIILSLSAAYRVAQVVGNLGLRFQPRDELDEII